MTDALLPLVFVGAFVGALCGFFDALGFMRDLFGERDPD